MQWSQRTFQDLGGPEIGGKNQRKQIVQNVPEQKRTKTHKLDGGFK